METGVNLPKIESAIKLVQDRYDIFYNDMGELFQTNVLNSLGKSWYSPHAKSWIGDRCTEINKLCRSLDDTISSLVAGLNSAANVFCVEEQILGYTQKSLTTTTFTALNKCEEKREDGFQGVVEENMNITKQILESTISTLKTDLSNIGASVDDCGFIGGNMATSISSAFELIVNQFRLEFEKLKQALESDIDTKTGNLTTIASEVSSSFTISS